MPKFHHVSIIKSMLALFKPQVSSLLFGCPFIPMTNFLFMIISTPSTIWITTQFLSQQLLPNFTFKTNNP